MPMAALQWYPALWQPAWPIDFNNCHTVGDTAATGKHLIVVFGI